MSWLGLARAALGLALDEIRDRRARQRAQDAFARGPVQTLVTCSVCGARVRADAASMSAHSNQHKDRH